MRLIWLFLLAHITLFAQTAHISGYIYAAASGEALSGASIYMPATQQGVLTDNYGRFNFSVEIGKPLRIQISYVGCQVFDTVLTAQHHLEIDFYLLAKTLEEVVVLSEAGRLQANQAHLSVERLKAIPMLMGQPDLIKALATLPGITSGVEGTTGLYVRGGTPDQNLILLDGATVYNASHLFGFQSIFDPSAIKDIRVIKGAFPAKYGGRLSSIVDITMKEGNNQEHHGEFSVGLVNSGLMLEGPIKKGRSSFMASTRAAYLGLLLLPTALGWKTQDDRPFNTLLSYDLNLKFNHQFKNKDKFFASFYLGNDNLLTRFRFDNTLYRTDLGWGNRTASLRYLHHLGKKVYAQSIATFTNFQSAENNRQLSLETDQESGLWRQSKVRDYTFKQLFVLPAGPRGRLTLGGEASWQVFQPTNFVQSSSDALSLDSVSRSQRKFPVFSAAGFADFEWQWWPWLSGHAGLRWAYFGQVNTRSYLEPRLQVKAEVGDFNFDVGFNRNAQFVHLLANNTVGLFTDLWVPSTATIAPQTAQQFSTGVTWRSSSAKWEGSLEGFYKTLQNQIDYRQGTDFFRLSNQDWQNTIESGGQGRARGLEAMIKYESLKLNGWVAYTWSWNERQFANINRGAWYPHRYDRRNNLNANGLFQLSSHWTLSVNWVFQTGSWITLPAAAYWGYRQAFSNLAYEQGRRADVYSARALLIYTSRNNQRLPDFHRLDLTVVKKIERTPKNRRAELSFSLYNAYARRNPYILTLSHSFGPDLGDLYRLRVRSMAMFTFIPAIAYTKKW